MKLKNLICLIPTTLAVVPIASCGNNVDPKSIPLCFIDVKGDDAPSTINYTADEFEDEKVDTSGIQYSFDNETWNDWSDPSEITINSDDNDSTNDKVYVRNTNDKLSIGMFVTFSFQMTGSINATGNVNSMINYGNLSKFCFKNLFINCTSLKTPPVLPSTKLEPECYECMFSGCTNLIEAPELPASSLVYSCYYEMFFGCTSLKKHLNFQPWI